MIYYIQSYIFYYLGVVNILSLALMIYDKFVSRFDKVALRVPEKTLLFFAAIGGAAGTFIGMAVFRHKTKHKNFKALVPVLFAVWVIICLYVFFSK